MSTRLLSVAVAILFVFAIGESIYISGVLSNIHQTLCQQHFDLHKRYEQGKAQYAKTKAYVDSDTNGKVFGIPTSVLKANLKVQATLLKAEHDTLVAQQGLNCKN
jgi:hypothetical protein